MTSTNGPDGLRDTLTVAGVCEAIWDTERELGLLDWKVRGVAVWPIVRMRVFHELTRRSGLLGDPHPVRRTTGDKLHLVGRHLVALVRHNPFLRHRSYDAAVVPHHRKLDGVEIYSAQLRAELGDRALVLDSNINGVALPGADTLDFFTSFAGFRGRLRQRLGQRMGRRDLTAPDSERVTAIEDALDKRLGLRVPLTGLVGRELTKHLALRRLYRSLLRRRGIQTLYVVVGYFHQHVVAAARDLGIRVVELQHGTITPYHLGYSYPGSPAVPDQPDELWCFGPYWAETVDLPGGMTTRVIGAPFVRRLTPEQLVAKDPALVVFVSQGTTGQQLLPVATKLAELRPELSVVFRLHPSEHRSDYTAGVVAGPDNIRLSGGRATPGVDAPVESTYDLMAAATYLAGVSTTALFEGMVLGCRTIVVDLAGAEYMAPAVERGDAISVGDAAELARRLDDAPMCAHADAYYAPAPARIL
jgi:hypothetical protein